MSNNPLKQYFRRPAIYLTLPSKGKDYPPGVIDFPENGELPIYPMTAIDEITTKTPDALFNGNAVAELIKSCVPNIKDPWQVSSTDLDAILLAIKAASGSENLEIDSTCPSCKEQSTYKINLVAVLSTLTSPDYSTALELGELKIKFGPLTYSEVNEAGLAQFEVQRMFANLNQITDEKEKGEKTKNALISVTEVTMNLIAKTIQYIETNDVRVDNVDHIKEFLQNCDKNMYVSIRDYHTKLKSATEIKPLDVKCISCEHEYKQPFTLNVSDFFG
jgi:hypothetical protein